LQCNVKSGKYWKQFNFKDKKQGCMSSFGVRRVKAAFLNMQDVPGVAKRICRAGK
jgi:hypothetical protein